MTKRKKTNEKFNLFHKNQSKCFELLFHPKETLDCLFSINICPDKPQNEKLINLLKEAIFSKMNYLYDKTIDFSKYENFRFKSLNVKIAENYDQISILTENSKHPERFGLREFIPSFSHSMEKSISILAPGTNLINVTPNSNFIIPNENYISNPTITPIKVSQELKNIDCIIKEGHAYFIRCRTFIKIIAPSSIPINDSDQMIPVKMTLNSNDFTVYLANNLQILRFQLNEIQSVQKSNSNQKCFNIIDIIGNKFKFCQIDNIPESSCDDWIKAIVNYKNKCSDSFALIDASFEFPIVPNRMNITSKDFEYSISQDKNCHAEEKQIKSIEEKLKEKSIKNNNTSKKKIIKDRRQNNNKNTKQNKENKGNEYESSKSTSDEEVIEEEVGSVEEQSISSSSSSSNNSSSDSNRKSLSNDEINNSQDLIKEFKETNIKEKEVSNNSFNDKTKGESINSNESVYQRMNYLI